MGGFSLIILSLTTSPALKEFSDIIFVFGRSKIVFSGTTSKTGYLDSIKSNHKSNQMNNPILTKKERTIVIKMLDDCLPAKTIAKDLNKSPNTINNQIKGIYRKMNVRCIAELAKKLRTGPLRIEGARVIEMFPAERKTA